MRIYKGDADDTVLKMFIDELFSELLAKRDAVKYATYPGVNHTGIPAVAEPEALAFFARRLRQPAGLRPN